jgi:plastocyanin
VIDRHFAGAAVAALALGVYACGGDSSPSPIRPGGSSAPPADAIVVDIVGINGTRSFAPNPAAIPSGQMVVWHNVDATTHRVVLDDRRIDTGNIRPDGFSAPTMLGAPGPYHCSIHPEMTGTVDAAR